MSKTAIVKSGERFFIKQLSESQPIKLDRVIFANIPGVNSNTEIDINGTMPDAGQIVHTAPVTQSGLLNDRTVVYSVILDTNVGDFSFNYMGLVNAETNTLCMVMHTDLTKKIKTAGQRQGNTITESIWLEIDNASESTGITVNAETWQIDYSKRLAGEDERIRLTNYDLYNRIAINTGLNITKLHNQLTVSPGIAYINGLRVQLSESIIVVVEHNQSLYIDAWLAGTITGEWAVKFNLMAGTNLRDYHDGNFQHYVERIASVDNVGNLIKVNPQSFVTTFDLASLTKIGIVKLSSAIDSTSETEAATPKAVSQVNDYSKEVNERVNLIVDRFQPDYNETRMYSHDKRFYIVMRDDGTAGMYSHVKNELSWFINHDGWFGGHIDCQRVTGLDQFVRDRTLPVGVPLPWPTLTPPAGWLVCNGWKFDKNKYPRLAAAYQSGYLPDMRANTIRGLDAGRGIDINRVILSEQGDAMRNLTGTFGFESNTSGNSGTASISGAFYAIPDSSRRHLSAGTAGENTTIAFDAARQVPVANEFRVRNIAFMYIVKAE